MVPASTIIPSTLASSPHFSSERRYLRQGASLKSRNHRSASGVKPAALFASICLFGRQQIPVSTSFAEHGNTSKSLRDTQYEPSSVMPRRERLALRARLL